MPYGSRSGVLVETPRVRLGNRSPVVSEPDKARWSELKPKLRQHLAAVKIGMSAVAEATSLPLSTIQRSLSPAGPTPGRGIIELLARWLATQRSEAAPQSSAIAETSKAPARISHDRVGAAPVRRLSETQAGRLSIYLASVSGSRHKTGRIAR